MSSPANGNGGTWKWIAGMLAAVILTGLPGYVALFRTGGQVDDIEQRQQLALVAIAQLQAQQDAIIELLKEARDKIDELKATQP